MSPAVIVPRMLRLMEEGYGANKGIPQMILAGASVDDVFVIVLFTSFTGMAQGGSFSPAALAGVPVSIVLGGAAGLGLGYVLAKCFTRFHLRDSAKVVVLLALAFLLVALEDAAEGGPLLRAAGCSGDRPGPAPLAEAGGRAAHCQVR